MLRFPLSIPRPAGWALVALVVLAAASVLACSGGGPVRFHAEGAPELLSEWRLLRVDGSELALADGVVPYDLNTPLFTDYAHKLRTVWMPEGTRARLGADGELEYPVGTIFSKTFYYPLPAGAERASGQVARTASLSGALVAERLPLERVRLLETRLLVHRESGWVALPYVWNDAQTEARLALAGAAERLELVGEDRGDGEREPFLYVVPDVNQCAGCHATDHTAGEARPIGPKIRHLNRTFAYATGPTNQLTHWAEAGYLPALDPATAEHAAVAFDPESGTLEERARAYLDINCGHCHNPKGAADTSGLFLDWGITDLRRLGKCKPPIAAGRGSGDRLVSIDPGHPERSILVYRMGSVDPGIAMPELGRSTVHREGVELVTEWVRSLEGECRPALAIGG